jgi:hypothetical protein
MARMDLSVPYSEKDEAKKLGAKWDPTAKLWYVPDGVEAAPFARWMKPADEADEPNIRSKSFYIAEATRACWKCHRDTRVYGFMLPAGFEALYVGDSPEEDEWETYDVTTVLSYIGYLCESARNAMQAVTRTYRLSRSKTTKSSYWANRCEHCDALQGDNETIDEFDTPLSPVSREGAEKILLRHYEEPFEAGCGSYRLGVDYFEFMRRTGPVGL